MFTKLFKHQAKNHPPKEPLDPIGEKWNKVIIAVDQVKDRFTDIGSFDPILENIVHTHFKNVDIYKQVILDTERLFLSRVEDPVTECYFNSDYLRSFSATAPIEKPLFEWLVVNHQQTPFPDLREDAKTLKRMFIHYSSVFANPDINEGTKSYYRRWLDLILTTLLTLYQQLAVIRG